MRVTLALLAFGVTAFAPAPFPKADRERDVTVNLNVLQGTWKVARIEGVLGGGRLQQLPWNVASIRISGGRFVYLSGEGHQLNTYRIAVGGTKPTAIDLD